MRITTALMKFKKIGGNLFKGKHRLVKVVTPLAKNNMRNELILEEKNMFYLTHPYLKTEEIRGYAKVLGKHEQWINDWNVKHLEEFSNKKQKTIESHLEVLKLKDDWDVIK